MFFFSLAEKKLSQIGQICVLQLNVIKIMFWKISSENSENYSLV